MNEQRRKILSELFVKIEEIKGKVEDWRDEEQDAFDAMPSSFQQSDCGKASEVSISCIEGAIDGLEKALDQINDLFFEVSHE